MLEQQQAQLVSALEEMYYQLRKASAWEGPSLNESGGRPLTHDILSALDLLEIHDKSSEEQVFNENCDKLRSRMDLHRAGLARRRELARSKIQIVDRIGVTPSLVTRSTYSKLGALLQQSNTDASLRHSTIQGPPDYFNHGQSYLPESEQAPMKMDDTLHVYRDESKSFSAPESARESTYQRSPTSLHNEGPQVLEWEHAIMKMDETVQAYRDRSEDFGASESRREPAPFLLDSHQDMLVSNDAFGAADMNTLFQLDWIENDFHDFVWQPEVPTWAT